VIIAKRMLGRLGHRFDPVVYKLAQALRLNRNPSFLTFVGFVFNGVASVLVALGDWFLGGLIVLIGGLFDMMDGAVARVEGKSSVFGAFFDSVMDRFSDFLVFIGLAYFYCQKGEKALLLLTLFALMGSILVPFCRARAEVFIPSCKIGLLERPERVLLMAFGFMSGLMLEILLIVTVLSFLTVFQRIVYTKRALSKKEGN
jgi:phosphatidylglycerophosphate synthase